jgi:hypothetical protein
MTVLVYSEKTKPFIAFLLSLLIPFALAKGLVAVIFVGKGLALTDRDFLHFLDFIIRVCSFRFCRINHSHPHSVFDDDNDDDDDEADNNDADAEDNRGDDPLISDPLHSALISNQGYRSDTIDTNDYELGLDDEDFVLSTDEDEYEEFSYVLSSSISQVQLDEDDESEEEMELGSVVGSSDSSDEMSYTSFSSVH